MATAAFSLGGPAGGDYSYSFKPGGVDYFRNGQPITNAQYDSANTLAGNVGPHSSALESQAGASVLGDSTTSQQGGTSGGSSTTNPALAASYASQAQALQDSLNALPDGLNGELGNIRDAYNTAVNKQNQGLQDSEDQYNTTKANNATNEANTQDQIATSGRNNGNAIQRLLGLAGSGNSSASEIAAPYLVNQQTATAGRQAQTTFGQNEQALETSINKARRDNTTALGDLAQNEFAQEQQARGAENAQASQILQSLMAAIGNQGFYSGQDVSARLAPLQAQNEAAIKAAAGYTPEYKAPVFQVTPTSYAPPSLSSFATGVLPVATTNQVNTPAATQANNVTVAPPAQPQQPLKNPLLAPVGK